MRDVRDWLSGPEPVQRSATDVRGKYLDFLCWPRGKPERKAHSIGPCEPLEDSCPEIKRELVAARAQAAKTTWAWLKDVEGRDDTLVRTKYLEFLLAMPDGEPPFNCLRPEVAIETWRWLNEEGRRSTDVRTKYLQFLWATTSDDQIFESLRHDVASGTLEWLELRRNAPDIQEVLGALLDVTCHFGSTNFVDRVIDVALEAIRHFPPGAKPTRHQNIIQRLIKLLERRRELSSDYPDKTLAAWRAINEFKKRNPDALSSRPAKISRQRNQRFGWR
jgi:hypothetical protein